MKPLLILICLFLFLQGQAQSPRKDSACFVLLRDSQKIYSGSLQLKYTNTADKYIELGDHRQIPIEKVSRFRSGTGTYITIPGSAGTDIYKVEREGSKISLYSHIIDDPIHAN